MKNKEMLSLLSIITLATFIVGYSIAMPHNQTTIKEPQLHIYSHRGASGEEVEHTFAAYDLAILYGSNFIEQDLVTSKNGTLYVSHDKSAKRITGVDKKYVDLTDDEINKLRTSSNEPIYTMDAVFKRYKDNVNYVIELKDGSSQVDKFKKLVKDSGLEENIIVQSSDLKTMKELETIFPDMQKLCLVSNQRQLDNSLKEDSVDIVGMVSTLMTTQNINLVHKSHKKADVWTLNSMTQIKSAIDLNVDTYFTNFTAKAFVMEDKYR